MIPGVEAVGVFSMTSSPKKLEEHRMIDLAVKRSDHSPAHWVHSKVLEIPGILKISYRFLITYLNSTY